MGTPLSRRGERGPRAAGAGADRRAEGGGSRGGVTGPTRWKCSESLFSARPGAEPPGLLFVLSAEEPPWAFTWNGVPVPLPATEAGGASSCSNHGAPGLPNSLLAWSLRLLSWPGGCFSCLESALWHRHRCCGKPLGGSAGTYRPGERERDREEGV